jgi:hypothetical protein
MLLQWCAEEIWRRWKESRVLPMHVFAYARSEEDPPSWPPLLALIWGARSRDRVQVGYICMRTLISLGLLGRLKCPSCSWAVAGMPMMRTRGVIPSSLNSLKVALHLVNSLNTWRAKEVRRSTGNVELLPKLWEGWRGWKMTDSRLRAGLENKDSPWTLVAGRTPNSSWQKSHGWAFTSLPRFRYRLALMQVFYIISILHLLRFGTNQTHDRGKGDMAWFRWQQQPMS